MRQSDDLYQLIKSLDKNEKRYFKLFSSFQSGDKYYLELFDAMDKQKEYDEAKLKREIQNQKLLHQYPVIKHYLLGLIIKSLSEYYSGKTIDSQIRKLMGEMEMLFIKGFYSLALRSLHKAKTLALKYDKQTVMPDIIFWERKICLLDEKYEGFRAQFDGNMSSALKELENIREIYRLSFSLYKMFGERGKPRTPEDLLEYKKIHDHPLLQNESNATNFQSKWMFYNSHIYFYRLTGDYNSALHYAEKALQHLESKGDLTVDEIHKQISSLQNLILVLGELQEKEKCLAVINKLRELLSDKRISMYKEIEVRIFTISYTQEIELYTDFGDFEKGLTLTKEIQEGLNRFKNKIRPYDDITFHFILASLYFGAGDFHAALKWISKTLVFPQNIRVELQSFGRILNLLIHFELGNDDMMNYLLKSTYRFLYKKERLFQVENHILRFIKKLTVIPERKMLINEFIILHKELLPLLDDPYESRFFEYFDLIAWLQSKIDKIPFADAIKARRAAKNKA